MVASLHRRAVGFLSTTLLLLSSAAYAPPLGPATGVVLGHDLSWRSTRWPGVDWTRSAAVAIETDHARFTVRQPDHGHVWYYRLHAPIARHSYPSLFLTYRAGGLATDGFLLWLDDGRGLVYSDWMPLHAAEVINDGEIHTLHADLREHEQGDWVEAVAIALRSGESAPAWLELIDLRFEAAAPVDQPEKGTPVAVRVTDDDGDPVDGATVVLDAERANWSQTARTDAQGKATLTPWAVPRGEHTIRVSATGYATTERRLRAGNGEAQVEVVPATEYGGQVVDTAGQPMPGVSVQARVSFAGAPWWRPVPTVFTDDEGQWRLLTLPSTDATFDLLLSHPDVSPLHVPDLSPKQLADGTARIEMPGTDLDVHRAARLGMTQWLRVELTRDPLLVGLVKDGDTPLYTAVEFDQGEIVDVLAELGAQINAPGNSGTALHRALQLGSLQAARQLLVHGADPDMRNASDSAPIHHAIWAQSDGQCTEEALLEAIDLLAGFGADMNAVHKGVGTPLDYATRVSPESVLELLQAHGANLSEEAE